MELVLQRRQIVSARYITGSDQTLQCVEPHTIVSPFYMKSACALQGVICYEKSDQDQFNL